MRALSIRQPYAELILRGIKPIEFRSRPTKIIGERFHIYASRQWAAGKLFLEGCRPSVVSGPLSVDQKAWSHDLAMAGDEPQPWMLELAKMLILKDLPMGVIVGSAVIEKVTQAASTSADIDKPGQALFEWHLGGIERARKLRKPKGHPQPVWFTPF
jgi:predicted transcriptional regulator